MRPESSADRRLELETILPEERARLVRLCTGLTGNLDAAEDLAQETLIAAWRHADTLRDPRAGRQWLTGIARNVCRRWAYQQRRANQISSLFDGHAEHMARAGSGAPVDGVDIEIDLEREELATLLDRALALLPPTSRDVLVQRFVEERSHAEIAERLGLSEGAATLRVHRGKLALRRALSRPELSAEAATFGLVPPEVGPWQATRIACPFCGRRTLLARIDRAASFVSFRCADPCVPDGTIIGSKPMMPGTAKLTSAKSILTRELLDLDASYRRALGEGGSQCRRCGRRAALERWMPESGSVVTGYAYGIRIRCSVCGELDTASLWHLTLDTPAAQRFWRRYPRMRALPVLEIEAEGRTALLSGFVSLDAGARLEVLSARDTYEILRIDGSVQR